LHRRRNTAAGIEPGTFVDLSLSDTITTAISMAGGSSGGTPALAAEALQLAKKFKVSDSTYTYHTAALSLKHVQSAS
jgi:hypothetical protein